MADMTIISLVIFIVIHNKGSMVMSAWYTGCVWSTEAQGKMNDAYIIISDTTTNNNWNDCQSNCESNSLCKSIARTSTKCILYNKKASESGTGWFQGADGYLYKEYTCYPEPCTSAPCQNSGSCDDNCTSTECYSDSGFTCSCVNGYSGTTCETDPMPCYSNPCRNSANCTDGTNLYTCQCGTGYMGANCETFVPCSSDPCENGATCVNGTDGFTCNCSSGYYGAMCQNYNPEGSDPQNPKRKHSTTANRRKPDFWILNDGPHLHGGKRQNIIVARHKKHSHIATSSD